MNKHYSTDTASSQRHHRESARAAAIRKAVQQHLSPEAAKKRAKGHIEPEIDVSSLRQAAAMYKDEVFKAAPDRSAKVPSKGAAASLLKPGGGVSPSSSPTKRSARSSSSSRPKAKLAPISATGLGGSSSSLQMGNKRGGGITNKSTAAINTSSSRSEGVLSSSSAVGTKTYVDKRQAPTTSTNVSVSSTSAPAVSPIKQQGALIANASSGSPRQKSAESLFAEYKKNLEVGNSSSSTSRFFRGGSSASPGAPLVTGQAPATMSSQIASAIEEELQAVDQQEAEQSNARSQELAEEAKTVKTTIAQVEASLQRSLREFQESRSKHALLQEENEKTRKFLKSSQTRVITAQAKISALTDRKKHTRAKLEAELQGSEREFKKKAFKLKQKLRDLTMQLKQGEKKLAEQTGVLVGSGAASGSTSSSRVLNNKTAASAGTVFAEQQHLADTGVQSAAGAIAPTNSASKDAGIQQVGELRSELEEIEHQKQELLGHLENLQEKQSELEVQKKKLCAKYQVNVSDADARFSAGGKNLSNFTPGDRTTGGALNQLLSTSAGGPTTSSTNGALTAPVEKNSGAALMSTNLNALPSNYNHRELGRQELLQTEKQFRLITSRIRREQSKLLRLDREFSQLHDKEVQQQKDIRSELEMLLKELNGTGSSASSSSPGAANAQQVSANVATWKKTIKQIEKELQAMVTEFEVKKKVLLASVKDIEHDLEERRHNVNVVNHNEAVKNQSMIQLRLDQLSSFEARLVGHEETHKAKKAKLEKWLVENKMELQKYLEENHDTIVQLESTRTAGADEPGAAGAGGEQIDDDVVVPEVQEQLMTDLENLPVVGSMRTQLIKEKYQSLVNHLAELEADAAEQTSKREEVVLEIELKLASLFKEREEAKKQKEKLQGFLASVTNDTTGSNMIGSSAEVDGDAVKQTIHEYKWVKSSNVSTQNKLFQLIERNRKEFIRLEEIYQSLDSVEDSMKVLIEYLDKLQKCKMLVVEKLDFKEKQLLKLMNPGEQITPASATAGSRGRARFSYPSEAGTAAILQTQERVESLLRNYDPKVFQDSAELKKNLAAKEKDAYTVEKELQRLESSHARDVDLYRQGLSEEETTLNKEITSSEERVEIEQQRAVQLKKQVEKLGKQVVEQEDQTLEKDRKCKFLQTKLSELRNLLYVIEEKESTAATASKKNSKNTTSGASASNGGGIIFQQKIQLGAGGTSSATSPYGGAGASTFVDHQELKTLKTLPEDIHSRIEEITNEVRRNSASALGSPTEDEEQQDEDMGKTHGKNVANNTQTSSKKAATSSKEREKQDNSGDSSSSLVYQYQANQQPSSARSSNTRGSGLINSARTENNNPFSARVVGGGGGAPVSTLNSPRGVPPSLDKNTALQNKLPSLETIQTHFGREHPAYLFYMHLLPLLKGIAVMQLQKKQNLWQPRIVSVSNDYGRVQFHSEEKIVAETFLRTRSLKSVNVPDPTLKLLQDVARGVEIKSSRSKAYHLHILRFDGDPVRLSVPTITTFHLLTQAFKILCETPKEQLSYFAVVLGLKST
ncbi:unnamed protein product [Amoebophrya sp. A120]|nr:unnamed protein product [Amoebophrya sp. A120]|eukprot:GSA120T00019565001.1